MKPWTGGILILSLALLLFLPYALFPPSSSSPPAAPRYRFRRRPAPLLASLPGLADLFPSPNSTAHRSQSIQAATLAWAHMRPLLARSDALPATADGVREAAAAWKDLLAAVGALSIPDAASGPIRSCPYSVIGNGSMLEIPCGFVEDTAVTVVGVPLSRNGSSRFEIELLGSNSADGKVEPPVVLRCNVTLGKDGPYIAQNSWTAELGWGEWDHCPAHEPAGNATKVDGLVRCHEQTGESVIPESVNASQIEDEKLSKQPKQSSHLSVGFPFVEGQPFTATLWAGTEGFHMTVNGRHETSFAYRERLEPWSVTKVRVAGNLNLLSALANGLPVSEDVNVVGDVELLKAPPIRKKRITMLVGIFSTVNNFKHRMALRRSWMQYEAVRSGDVAVRFFTGLHKKEHVNLELWREAQIYGDIQLMPFVDYYSLITLKTIAICIYGMKILPAKYIMKMDDDAFVRIDEVLSILNRSNSKGLLYGLISFQSSPHRDKDSKWYISRQEWPTESYPPWAHGPGYIISRDVTEFIVQGHQERCLQLFKLEDVAMGIWIKEYEENGQEVSYINDDRFHHVGCESDYILAHYQSPRLLLCLWEKLQKEQKPVCCE